jgi:signal transduction histidine kinase
VSKKSFLEHPGRPLRWAALIVLVFAVAAAVLASADYGSKTRTALGDAQLRARGAAAYVDRYVQSQWSTLHAIASIPFVKAADLDAIQTYFDTLDSLDLGLDAGISFIDRDGLMRVRTGGYRGPPIDFGDRAHIRRALATQEPAVSSGLIGAVNQGPIVAFVVPVTDAAGAFRGLIGSGVRLDRLSIGATELAYAGGTSVVIVDGDGQIIAGPRPIRGLEPVAESFPLDMVRSAGVGAMEMAAGPYGEPDQIVGFAAAQRAGWTVTTRVPASSVIAPAHRDLVLQLIVLAIAAATTIALLFWAARRLEQAAAAERRSLSELQVAIDTLERRQALSDAFAGVMSHELRTPVTSIATAAELLRLDVGREQAPELVDDIVAETERMKRITDDLLVLSRAQFGVVETQAEPVLIQRLLPPVIADVTRRFPSTTVVATLADDLPVVSGDEGALRQVLSNLLTNAAKYASGPVVEVRVAVDDDRAEIIVEDQGPGVEREELPRLFDLFYRAASTSMKPSGSGIGLFVVRELVNAMGGQVRAEAVDPHGLRIVIHLPLFPVDAADASGPGPLMERPALHQPSSGAAGVVAGGRHR